MKKKKFVFDSYALLAFFQGEPAGQQVKEILTLALEGKARVYISLINIGEIFYITARKFGLEKAQEIINDLKDLPVSIEGVDLEKVLKAASIKAQIPLAYADAFAAALAKSLGAILVTGDPEFKPLEEDISILWL